ncbi:UDP-galactopyranose mutase [Helicobacter sp. MIT 21-1697]|uniref:UDP-galactopyranose mutase n=1 Tax=Helicobacter sp. MIT 21-1697 TaxID=2993733 RepID=UPI00224B4082|nr:UDP-galactopyranose mutase [Helicobacter sp. MIT 21-1697]MCX2717301.1 UDP-galactopyranose mutase [Helicobacter sp. MIT 21-1697]
MKAKNCIVGAGLAGLTLAERLANVRGESVLLIDRRNHIGGNVYDYDDEGILVHQYGTHIFHSNEQKVWQYVNIFSRFYPYMHEVKALVDGSFVPVPFNLNSLFTLFPAAMAQEIESMLLQSFEYGSKVSILELQKHPKLAFLSQFIYEKIFLHYTLKQWQCTPQELDSSVFERVPVSISRDNRYFQDRFQGIPMQGYTKMCEKMIANPLITLKLECDYKDIADCIECERIFYSGAIDEFFDYELGELPYRSLHFDFMRFEREYFQSGAVINYPNNYDFTRIGEYKYFLDSKTPHSIVSFEYPKAWHRGEERYYPVPNEQSAAIYQAYARKANELKNVHFIGRLGEYRYYDMDKVIARALSVFENLA